jgi:organic radical activating enzyme
MSAEAPLRILPSGELEVRAVVGGDEAVDRALTSAFARLRGLSARENVARLGRDQGYRIEDVVHIEATGIAERDVARVTAWLERRLPRDASVVCNVGEGPLSLCARIAPRGPEHAREYRAGPDGRVAVESIELHVVEHCNLRCAQCCNVSPYLSERLMTVSEVRTTCDRLRDVVRPDVLKIMGGEPLLHPDIGGLLRAIRESRVAPRIRLFTNGLLLRTLDDASFAALDEITVSSYASAPVKPELLAETEERARRFDVVLNVKVVDAFSTVLSRITRTQEEIKATYDACWLRHRCLVVRDGVFYKCTRAAYYGDFHARVDVDRRDVDAEATQRALGIRLDAPDFAATLAAYLTSRDVLASCTHCFGSSGPLAPHVQLKKRDVGAGRLLPSASKKAV